MTQRRRIPFREAFSKDYGPDSTGGEASLFVSLWYWIAGVPVKAPSSGQVSMPPTLAPNFVEIVPLQPVKDADGRFDEWLRSNGLNTVTVAKDLQIDDWDAQTGKQRRYAVRRGSPSDRTA